MFKSVKFTLSATAVILIILSTVLLLTGCGGNLANKLTAHEWVKGDITYIFYENGTYARHNTGFAYGTDNGTWTIEGDVLTISGLKESFKYKSIDTNSTPENSLNDDEWYVSNQFLYFNGFEYIAQN